MAHRRVAIVPGAHSLQHATPSLVKGNDVWIGGLITSASGIVSWGRPDAITRKETLRSAKIPFKVPSPAIKITLSPRCAIDQAAFLDREKQISLDLRTVENESGLA